MDAFLNEEGIHFWSRVGSYMKPIVFLALVMLSAIAVSEAYSPRVLLLNSYHPQYAWTDQLTDGVVEALITSVPQENIHVEYMDSRRFVDDEKYSESISRLLQYKYQKYRPDIIITGDDHAYHFMLDHGQTLFPNKPVVFSGVNVFDPTTLIGRKNFTGIQEGMEIEGNIELIMQLQPNVKRIVMLGDTTGLGLRMVRHARQLQLSWSETDHKHVDLEIWDRFSLEELYQKVSVLPEDTAVLMLAIHKDKLGRYFSFEKELPRLTDKSSVPVYGMWGALMIGHGVIGGMMNDPREHGKAAAYLALAILSGVPVTDIHVRDKAEYAPVFDYDVLKKFAIPFSRLPNSSRILNQPRSIYTEYRAEITVIALFMLILVIIINLLLINIRKRSQIKKQLDAMNQELEARVKARTEDLNARNSELEDARKRMEELAHTDPLTGLGNRRAGLEDLHGFVNRAKREGQAFSLAIIDIDFFKKVNDQYGHHVGDEVLVGFGQVLRRALRPSDRVYRWGGEEFLVVLPYTDMQFASAVCNRIVKSLHDQTFDQVGTVTASIGVASLTHDDSLDTLLTRADGLLYKAKNNGRDQVMMG